MKKQRARPVEFVMDDWVKVFAKDEHAARRFFGAPPDWPVKMGEYDSRRPNGRVWLVKSEGLIIK